MRDEINHGISGRIQIYSEMNTDRDPPSRQVWIEMVDKKNKRVRNGILCYDILGTSSGNLVEDLGIVECDDGRERKLTETENRFVARIMEGFEGRSN